MFGKNKEEKAAQSQWMVDMWNEDSFWMPQELEFQHQNEEHRFRGSETNPLKLGKIIHSLFDIRKEELAQLTVNDGASLTNIEIQDEIWDYNLLDVYIRKIEKSRQHRPVIMTLFYREYEQRDLDKDKSISKQNACLIIHLLIVGGINEKVLYFQTTFCHPPIRLERLKKGMFSQAKNISILIGYDYRSEKEISEDFYNVFDSAKNKLAEGKVDELTIIERELLECCNFPDLINKNYYLGMDMMKHNRFWDAIAYFENTFNRLQEKPWKGTELNDDEWKIFVETSYWIGYCYYELGLFEKAYRYLEMPYMVNSKNYVYFTEYVNCLERLKDGRAANIIFERIKEINNKENQDENDWKLLLFCLRHKAYILIDFEQYELAKDTLELILKIEPDNEFAKGELEYISKINSTKQKQQANGFQDLMQKEFPISNTNGTDQDEMPEGYGEFGLEITNPIPTSSIPQSYLYLGRLRTINNLTVTYNRIGPMQAENIKSIIDGYSIFANGKQIATLYICPYNKKTSTKAPKGFKLV